MACTFRVTEHYLSGPMSRFNSWLNELMPDMFVELSPELAAERGIEHGGWLTVQSARGTIEARAMVTGRLRPLRHRGRIIHQIGIPFHWGFAGERVGDVANDLVAMTAEPNVSIQEDKAFAVNIWRDGLSRAIRFPPWPKHDGQPKCRCRRRRARRNPRGKCTNTGPTMSVHLPIVSERGLGELADGFAQEMENFPNAFPPRRTEVPQPGEAADAKRIMGFFTDTTLCIGCKACEVACKQWNQLPSDGFKFTGNSYDNTGHVSTTTWRHVAFKEQIADEPIPRTPMVHRKAAG